MTDSVFHRRAFLSRLAGLTAVAALPALSQASEQPLVEIWKSPTCGCCADWVAHLEKNGFRVRVHDVGNVAARQRLGIPMRYASCHTALVQGYAIEGHVPARDIHRLLRERPQAVGLSVPGMPIGSPGMDGPEYGGQVDPYDVVLIQRDGQSTVFQSYRPQA